MTEPIYERQAELNIRIDDEVYYVIGCGGTGFWTALFLAMSGVRKLILFDSDSIEVSNLNRLPLQMSDVGKRKTSVISKMIHSLRPECEILEMGHFVKELYPVLEEKKPSAVFCCTDSWKSQREIRDYCDNNFFKFIRIGYDGAHISVRHKLPAWGKDDAGGQGDGYQVIPSWIVPAAFAASIGVMKCLYPAAGNLETNGDIAKIIRRTENGG